MYEKSERVKQTFPQTMMTAVVVLIMIAGTILFSPSPTVSAASVNAKRKPTPTPVVTNTPTPTPTNTPIPGFGSWSLTGNMIATRTSHLAELLNDGRVLVAGGRLNQGGPTTTVEIYNPASGTWSPAASMNSIHLHGTMTKLMDGRVLVVGGDNSQGSVFASAELYDPATDTWSAAGNLNTERTYHTVALLADGRVLIAGGLDANGYSLASVEIYDPATGAWSFTASMIQDRFGHTATRLADGRVLVAGGYRYPYDAVAIASAEIYSPSTGVWSSTNSMAGTHAEHTATLLDNGKVLVVSGCLYSGSCGGSSQPYKTELYDPITSTWGSAGILYYPILYQAAAKLSNGKVLLVGEYFGQWQAWLYDPETNTYTPQPGIGPRTYPTATLLNSGQVLVAGGTSNSTGSGMLYTP